MSDLNKSLIKYGLLILTSPIWFPFLKAVWEELNRALREDGGLFGKLPSPRERERLRELEYEEEDPLVGELHQHLGRSGFGKQAARKSSSNSSATNSRSNTSFGGADRTAPKGFR